MPFDQLNGGSSSRSLGGAALAWPLPSTRRRDFIMLLGAVAAWPLRPARSRLIADAMLCPTISLDNRAPLLRAWRCRCVTTTSH
jgi:hypothetical protein